MAELGSDPRLCISKACSLVIHTAPLGRREVSELGIFLGSGSSLETSGVTEKAQQGRKCVTGDQLTTEAYDLLVDFLLTKGP